MSQIINATLERSLSSTLLGAREEIGEWLSRFVRFDTSNPPGQEGESQVWLSEEFAKLGLVVDKWDVLPGRPNTVATWKGNQDGRSLILNGHVDVAEVLQPEVWRRPPFSGFVENDKVYGRGSSDMKSGIAGFYFALKALRELGFEPAGDILVECVMGEEQADGGTLACLDRGYRADFAIVGEDSHFRAFANVGSLTGYVELRAPDSLHVNRRIDYLHAGGQLNAANVLEKLASRILPALNDLERDWANRRSHPLFPPGQEMIATFLITGGGNPSITPDVARLYFRLFYLPGRPKDEVLAEVENQIAAAAQPDPWLREHPPTVIWQPPEYPDETLPSEFEPDSEPVRLLAACHSSVADAPLGIGGLGFASDAGWLYQAGIPTVCYGPGDPAIAHGVDEQMSLDEVVRYARIVASFAAAWTGPA
jgi:acetylornithine deacetylase/succinyl-diaminopimelate desuccinylase family protein